MYVSPAAFSVSNNTDTVLATLNLQAGKYLIVGGTSWTYASTGYRYIYFGDARNTKHETNPTSASGEMTYNQVMWLVHFSSPTTLTLKGKQTSGQSLTVYPFISAYKLP